jgi:L-aminopeptidase/D-esterase-like protein
MWKRLWIMWKNLWIKSILWIVYTNAAVYPQPIHRPAKDSTKGFNRLLHTAHIPYYGYYCLLYIKI